MNKATALGLAFVLLAVLPLAACAAPQGDFSQEDYAVFGQSDMDWPAYEGETKALFPVYTQRGMALMDSEQTLVTGDGYDYLGVLRYKDEEGNFTDTPYTLARTLMEDGQQAYVLYDDQGQAVDDEYYETIEMLSPDVIAFEQSGTITLKDIDLQTILEGLAYVPRIAGDGVIATYEQGVFQAYDMEGKPLFEERGWDNVGAFAQGLVSASQEGLWGYWDEEGNEVIGPRFALAGEYSQGIAPVSVDGILWGYIDQEGELLSELVYDACSGFFGEVAYVCQEGFYGVINEDMEPVSPMAYDYAELLGAGYCLVYHEETNRFALFDKDGEVDTKGLMIAGAFGQDRLITFDGALYGLCDWNFETILSPQYLDIAVDKETAIVLKQVGKNELYALVDRNGEELLEPVYQWMEEYRGFYAVIRGAYYGYVDSGGHWVIRLPRFAWLMD